MITSGSQMGRYRGRHRRLATPITMARYPTFAPDNFLQSLFTRCWQVWDGGNGELMGWIQAHMGAVTCIATYLGQAGDCRIVSSGGEDWSLRGLIET
jgi:hypothetical protein